MKEAVRAAEEYIREYQRQLDEKPKDWQISPEEQERLNELKEKHQLWFE